MISFKHVDPSTANEETQDAFAEAQAQFGSVINLFKVLGNAPGILKGILALNREVASSTELDARLIEQVAMLTSALNKCDYCVNAHMKVGQSVGLSKQELLLALEGKTSDSKAQSLLNFTNEVVRNRGLVSDKILYEARAAGFSDKALLETIGVIGVYTTLQYVRHVANPAHDFPMVEEFNADKHGANKEALFIAG
ncbi:carboxymuconolactone decarboxylase family protein [Pseudoteredinibacter isoporae]|uniref:Putative peroxidase-related enzyme n=1 Tax=Pseudoteredinibacter isoporae TaxID=570281 RepID=A0A7X0JW57_9GAMM|nr:carboxymuconolactone decarboxylase family protein [Pseudoteredinibacter isoporae]MBB6522521.1 putative peroxidase-related enzyme [Pseudoteredinibacter isoporae]NHO88050.1 carboxymuconolactone decarboxylase family protein [Pseudoteredinibacter isoporae]NIB23619.1 carboxymuconolactone decarboxylase family protein [Pseudoteredinibacter isoporae]